MAKLKLGAIEDLKAGQAHGRAARGRCIAISSHMPKRSRARPRNRSIEPAKLIAPMLARFMATDRAFAKARRAASRLG